MEDDDHLFFFQWSTTRIICTIDLCDIMQLFAVFLKTNIKISKRLRTTRFLGPAQHAYTLLLGYLKWFLEPQVQIGFRCLTLYILSLADSYLINILVSLATYLYNVSSCSMPLASGKHSLNIRQVPRCIL